VTEAAHAALERGLGRAQREAMRDVAKARRAAGRDDQRLAGATAHVAAKECAVVATGERCRGRDDAWTLVDREALAGEHRLVHIEVGRREDDNVGRHDVAGGQDDHIAWNQLAHEQRDRDPIAQGPRTRPRPRDELQDLALRAQLTREADPDARPEDGHDDRCVDPLAAHG